MLCLLEDWPFFLLKTKEGLSEAQLESNDTSMTDIFAELVNSF